MEEFGAGRVDVSKVLAVRGRCLVMPRGGKVPSQVVGLVEEVIAGVRKQRGSSNLGWPIDGKVTDHNSAYKLRATHYYTRI